jgi:EmrB/QacA subfamily drug resistance transporter
VHSRYRIVALIVACALFMQNLETTILATALPQIAKSFGESPVNLHLVLTSYLMSLAIFMPISGWMADRFGTRTVFRAAILIFTGASVACACAGSLGTMIVARVIQGIGGAMMVPVARLALLRTVPKSDLVSAMTWVAVPALVGPVVGPPLGGAIVTYASWPWVFLINVPIGLLGFVLATKYIDDYREADVPPFDTSGFFLCSIAIAGIVFGFEGVGEGLLPLWLNVGLVAIGAVGAVLYLAHARRRRNPVLDLSLLEIPTLRASVLGGSLFRFGIGALPFLMPLMLQTVFQRTPLASGLITFAAAAGALLMKFAAQPILNRLGFRNVLVWNALLSAVSIALCLTFNSSTPAFVMFGVLLIGGFFRSLEFTAINIIGYADLKPHQMGRATSLVSMAQQLSLSVGVGIGAVSLMLSSMARGVARPELADFSVAFLVVAGLAAISAAMFARLPHNAGDEVARRQVIEPGEADAPAVVLPEGKPAESAPIPAPISASALASSGRSSTLQPAMQPVHKAD